jgi:hypothetical protein
MDYCKACKIHDETGCWAKYKNPTNSVETAIKQALNKGEWPCSNSPYRKEFVNQYHGEKIVWDKLRGFKK